MKLSVLSLARPAGLLAAALMCLAPAAHAFCFDEAGKEYGLNPSLLRGIAKVESNLRPAAINASHVERTRTVDLGLMQINSGWLSALSRYGITREALLTDACLNVKVGAWILARTFQRNGASWDGVGAYNAVCTQLKGDACTQARMTYARKVWAAMNSAEQTRWPRADKSPGALRSPTQRISTVVIAAAEQEAIQPTHSHVEP